MSKLAAICAKLKDDAVSVNQAALPTTVDDVEADSIDVTSLMVAANEGRAEREVSPG